MATNFDSDKFRCPKLTLANHDQSQLALAKRPPQFLNAIVLAAQRGRRLVRRVALNSRR
jgi:hypothetical protein